VKALLDTHVWLWSHLEPHRLSESVRRTLESTTTELWLSPVSVWETLLLVERGRLVLDRPAPAWMAEARRRAPVREAALTTEVALQSRALDLPHEDPADRFLAATALVFGLTLVTADRNLLMSRTVQLLRADHG
jgi:PIN domain nuclease of toxin-antitoxin system